MKESKIRIEALKPFSKEHDDALLMCSNMRTGLRNKVEMKRIKRYGDWFKEDYLDSHFEMEKRYIFPVLGNNNVRIKRACANHRRLNRLFVKNSNLNIVLNKIEEELGSYIRFEERILYNEIQKVASVDKLREIERMHHESEFSKSVWQDAFWLS